MGARPCRYMHMYMYNMYMSMYMCMEHVSTCKSLTSVGSVDKAKRSFLVLASPKKLL